MDLSVCPFIAQDVQRIIAARRVIEPPQWKATTDTQTAAASAAVETPVYRREQGLWPHQKYFAQLALERHRLGGARLVLADQVGLGKTIQLAMAALLMALEDPDGGPMLVLAPKPLLQQWQGRADGAVASALGPLEWACLGGRERAGIPVRRCRVARQMPAAHRAWCRKAWSCVGLPEALQQLLQRRYTCVIVDEAHRARRRNVPKVDASPDEVDERAEPNKLMAFLKQIGPANQEHAAWPRRHRCSCIPVEAWDLLDILSHGNDGVLGGWTRTSPWFRPSHCLAVANGDMTVPTEVVAGWQYVRDPVPARSRRRRLRQHPPQPGRR
jgi:hypothetical protein